MTKEPHKVRRFPAEERRVETGPVMFGEDWPGLFLRGDDCFRYVSALRELVLDNAEGGYLTRRAVMGLIDMLESSNCKNNDAFPAWRQEEDRE